MKRQESDNCPTRLLDDLPADHDAFGPHQRVAKAIADLIRTEKGGKAIALIGPWGSGKSTVVKLLEKELGEHKDIALFCFDAWEHQEDPLRRSFLERLIDFLHHNHKKANKPWLINTKEVDWKKEKDKIAKRLRITTTKRFPRLTKAGKITAFLAALSPIGWALLSSGTEKGWGWFLSLFPLGILAIFLGLANTFPRAREWLINVNREDNTDASSLLMTGSVREGKLNEDNADVFSLLMAGSVREDKTEKYDTPDPTSVEFQATFKKILDNALAVGNRKLIIVVDNLDRVSTEDALSLWATMRTFFEFGNSRPEWVNRLWLLVPFAPEVPSRLWREESNTKADNRLNAKPGKESDEDFKEPLQQKSLAEEFAAQKSLAEEFVDKTFQVKFYVPLPLMSDWKDFFQKQLQEAFPGHFKHHRNDVYALYRVFDSKRPCTHRPPTPREIKLFINQVGAYHRIWQDEIPLPVQALYVLDVSKRIEVEGPTEVLLDRNKLIEGTEIVFGKETRLQEYLAALHFNTDIDKAMQVLIGDEVREAFRAGNSETLKKLQSKLQPHAFLTVIERVIFSELPGWIQNEPSALAKAALALRELEQDELEGWEHIWQHLIEGSREAQWADLSEKVGEGLATIMRRSGSEYEQVAKAILKDVSELDISISEQTVVTLEPDTQEKLNVEKVKGWTKGLVHVLREVQQSGHQDLLSEFRIPGDAKFYIEVMRSLAESGAEDQVLAECFIPRVKPQEVVQQLTKFCQEGKLIDSYACAIRLMLKLAIRWEWQPFIQAIEQRLNTDYAIQAPELRGCLEALLHLESCGITHAQGALQRLTQQGHMFHQLHRANAQKGPKAVGLCLLPVLEYVPSGNIQSSPGKAQYGQRLYRQLLSKPPDDVVNVVKAVAGIACEFRKGPVLLQAVEKATTNQNVGRFVGFIFKEVIEQKRITELVSSAAVIDQYSILIGMLHSRFLSEEHLQELVGQLVEKGNLILKLTERDFSRDLADLYLRAFKTSNNRLDRQKFIQFLVEGLREIPKETWIDELVNEGRLLALVIALREEEISVGLSVRFSDALLEHAKQVFTGEFVPSRFKKQWDKVFEALEEDQRITFLRYLRDELIKQPDKDGTSILKLYNNPLLSNLEVLEEKSDEVLRYWFKGILERGKLDELDWLKRAIKSSKIYQKCPRGTKSAFRKEIQKAWEEAEDEKVKDCLKAVRTAVGLRPKPAQNPKPVKSQREQAED